MPRLPLIEPEQASPEAREMFEHLTGPNLPILNVMKLFANNTDLLAGLTRIGGAIYNDPKLSPRYRELAYLRASQVNSCHY